MNPKAKFGEECETLALKGNTSGVLTALAICIAVSGAISVHADSTTNLVPVADTTLQEAFPDNNLGGDSAFQAGGRRKGGITRALLLFDIADNIPAHIPSQLTL